MKHPSSSTGTDIPALLKAMKEVIPGRSKQADLAKRLKSVQPQVSRWMSGQQKPMGESLEKILAVARDMGVISDMRSEDVAADLATTPRARTVKLKGYVGAGSIAHYYNVEDQELEEVEAPIGASEKTVAVEIRGTSLGTFFDTWLVYYDDVRSPITDDMIGKLCVLGLADDRILIKRVSRDGRGGYRLLSNSPTEPPIEDPEIEWGALVTDMKQRL